MERIMKFDTEHSNLQNKTFLLYIIHYFVFPLRNNIEF